MSNPWTPGPWSVTQAYGDGCVNIMASGNELKVSGRSRRAQANRALIAAAPEMAEALEAINVLLNELQPHMTPEIILPERWNELVDPAMAVSRRIRGDAP